MRKHVIKLLLLLVVATAGVFYYLGAVQEPILQDWTNSDPPLTNREVCTAMKGGPYPNRLPRTVVLPIQDTNIRVGYDCYVEADRVERHIEFRDGQKEVIKYRPDGTVSERTRTFATVNGDIGRVKSHATYAADGTTFLSHDVYRGDGTLERSGRSERDGRYQTRYYFEDGITPERIRNFGRLKEFVSEIIYRRDGSELAAISVTMEGLELGITLYATDGKKLSTFYRTRIGERGYVYAPDGVTIVHEYAWDNYSRAGGYMDRKGRLMHKYEMRFNRLTVAFLSKDETKTYVQIRRDNDLVLRKVDEHDFNTSELVRTIMMSKDGSRPELVIYREGTGKLIKVLDENGMVVKIDHVARDGTVVRSEIPAQLQTELISKEALAEPLPLAEKPQFTLSGPPLVYDYE